MNSAVRFCLTEDKMQNKKKLSLKIAGTLALATLVGTSAFAEGRHQQRTERSSGGRIERGNSSRSSGSRSNGSGSNSSRSTGSYEHRGNTARNDSQRSFQRSETRGNIQRDDTRFRDSQRSDSRNRNDVRSNRNDVRSNRNDIRSNRNDRGSWRPDSRVAPSRGQRFDGHGRVERFVRERNGFRVFIHGGYPLFVPFSYWRLHPLRIGLDIRFGGYWDPLGYWSVYDYSPYDGYGYNSGYGYDSSYNDAYTSGEIRGVVESVDLRRGTLVINDDISRQFVTVTLPRDRRVESIREGDYVDFSGDWSRRGVFNAYRLERVEEGRY